MKLAMTLSCAFPVSAPYSSFSSRPTHILCRPHSWHFLRCSRVNFEDAYSRSCTSIDVVASETKKVATNVERGTTLVTFYLDQYNIPMKTTQIVLLDKCQETRLLLQNDTSFQTLFTNIPAPLVAPEELCLVYDERYVHSILDEDWDANKLQPFGFPWSRELVTRSRASTGGAVAAMHVVMLGLRLVAASIGGDGLSSHVGGSALLPSGVFNDVAVAASVALQSYPEICNAKRPVLVIDLDVCQKTDTIRLFQNENRVVTFNLHGSNNAPWRTDKRRDNDSGLLDCTGDDYYLAILADKLQHLFDFCNPGLVFFQAGVDALSEDTSGKLSMTRQGLIHRNNIVYTACFTQKVPLVITMGAGYSKPSEACLEAHADVYRTAALRYATVPAI